MTIPKMVLVDEIPGWVTRMRTWPVSCWDVAVGVEGWER